MNGQEWNVVLDQKIFFIISGDSSPGFVAQSQKKKGYQAQHLALNVFFEGYLHSKCVALPFLAASLPVQLKAPGNQLVPYAIAKILISVLALSHFPSPT